MKYLLSNATFKISNLVQLCEGLALHHIEFDDKKSGKARARSLNINLAEVDTRIYVFEDLVNNIKDHGIWVSEPRIQTKRGQVEGWAGIGGDPLYFVKRQMKSKELRPQNQNCHRNGTHSSAS